MRTVTVHDSRQDGYTYLLVCASGKEYDPAFKPQLTPQEMLELGVFSGFYAADYRAEFPESWFKKARISLFGPDDSCNFYRVAASQPLSVWQGKGWIYPEDPLGWFQWYCRYYSGRRLPLEDQRQIRRWEAISRHAGAIRKNCMPGDIGCRKKQRQALLHWAYDSRAI